MLPRHTSLVPGPARVTSAFICFGVRFCASSRIRKRLRNMRPRMKFSERILMRLRSRSLVAARPQLPPSPVLVSTSRLSMSAPIHGSIFSSSVPGRKPMSSPSGMVTRVMMISTKRFDSSVCMSPAASVSRVLPVPAGPRMVTKSISGSMSRLSAKFCSRLRAFTRQLERGLAGLDTPHDGLDAFAGFLVHELIHVKIGDHRPLDLVVRAIGFLPGPHVLVVRLPEIRRQRGEPGVEHIGIFDGLVAVIVLGVHADDRGLDSKVDVLGNQRYSRVMVESLKRKGLRKDGVVGAMTR